MISFKDASLTLKKLRPCGLLQDGIKTKYLLLASLVLHLLLVLLLGIAIDEL